MSTPIRTVPDSMRREPVPRQRGSRLAGQGVQGTLALDLTPETAPPRLEKHAVHEGADVVLVNPRIAADAQRWAFAFAQAVVEVISGDRPASQLVRWCTRGLHHEISYRAAVVARAGAHRAGQGRVRVSPVRPHVASVRTCFVTAAVVEVCAVIRHGERSRFLAGRIERRDGRWLCTDLEFG